MLLTKGVGGKILSFVKVRFIRSRVPVDVQSQVFRGVSPHVDVDFQSQTVGILHYRLSADIQSQLLRIIPAIRLQSKFSVSF